MKVDLHFHTNFSDSSRSVEDALDLADDLGLEYIAFADHDTTETYDYAKKHMADRKVKVIPSVEISAYDYKRDRKVHLLGYSYTSTKSIDQLCQDLLDRRKKNSEKQLSIILEAGYKINEEKLFYSKNSKSTLYKQQIMYALVEKPYYTEEYQDLYKKIFKNGGIAQGDIDYIDVFLALEAIKEDGGYAVLAHPSLYDSFELISDLVKEGLDGLEIFHPENSDGDRKYLLQLAEENNLMVTGGSDDHGIFGSQNEIGTNLLEDRTIEKLIFNK